MADNQLSKKTLPFLRLAKKLKPPNLGAQRQTPNITSQLLHLTLLLPLNPLGLSRPHFQLAPKQIFSLAPPNSICQIPSSCRRPYMLHLINGGGGDKQCNALDRQVLGSMWRPVCGCALGIVHVKLNLVCVRTTDFKRWLDCGCWWRFCIERFGDVI